MNQIYSGTLQTTHSQIAKHIEGRRAWVSIQLRKLLLLYERERLKKNGSEAFVHARFEIKDVDHAAVYNYSPIETELWRENTGANACVNVKTNNKEIHNA